MMKIGLIGSTSFYQTYQHALEKYPQVSIFEECNLSTILNEEKAFEALLSHCDQLVFETVNSNSFPLIRSVLKNGRHVLIEKSLLSAAETHEMYDIANEGNLHCTLFAPEVYYTLFEPQKHKIRNPYLIEMNVSLPVSAARLINEDIQETILNAVQNLLFLCSSDIRTISVKQIRIFSNAVELLSIYLEFSNGCTTQMRFCTLDDEITHQITLYQKGITMKFDLLENSTEITTPDDGRLSIPATVPPKTDLVQKKIEKILHLSENRQMQSQSVLEHYLALELSAKILKKINSFHD